MHVQVDETRKYIIGWLTFPPGQRAAFLRAARPFAQAFRQEPGCLFFEMNPSETDPDVVTVTGELPVLLSTTVSRSCTW